MAWPGIFQRLFANNGAGPKLRSDLFPLAVPATGAASGTGAPGMCYPDGTTLTMDASGMLTGADIGPIQTAVGTKLNTSQYSADAALRIKAAAYVNADGSIACSTGSITSATRISAGLYDVYCSDFKMTSQVVVSPSAKAGEGGVFATERRSDSAIGKVRVIVMSNAVLYNYVQTPADGGFCIIIMGG